MRRSRIRAPHQGGFTLVELMLAATLAAMLMIALAQTFSGFGTQLEVLREQEVDRQMDEAAVDVVHQVQRAWIVEEPADDELVVVDAYGAQTRYWLDGSDLKVRRPSGAVGTLIEDVQDFTIDTVTRERFRPDEEVESYDTWWVSAGSPSASVAIEEELPLALGFTLPSLAPVAQQTVSGLDEEAVEATLDRMLVSMAFAPSVVEQDYAGGDGHEDCVDGVCHGGSAKGGEDDDDDTGSKGAKGGKSDDDDDKDSKGSKGGKSDDDDKGSKGAKGGKSDDDDKDSKGSKGGKSDDEGQYCGGGYCKGSCGSSFFGGGKGACGGDKKAPGDDDAGGSKGGKGSDDDSKGGGSSKGGGGSKGGGCSGGKKVLICHIPPGNPANRKVLSISQNAVAAHLAHGDTLGACATPPPPLPDPWSSTLSVALHEARAPDDGRPFGPALAQVQFPVSALPGGSWTWVPLSSLGPGYTAVCHHPPGQPSDVHTLAVPTAELPGHLAHGDVLGSCIDGASGDATQVLAYTVPTQDVPLDLAPLAQVVEPGRAYTLVLSVAGRGTVLLGGSSGGTAATSGVATKDSGGSAFQSKPFTIQRALDGMVTYTATRAYDVVSSVTVGIEMEDGRSRAVTSAVLSQAGVHNPWLGAVPGEYPTLQEAGK